MRLIKYLFTLFFFGLLVSRTSAKNDPSLKQHTAALSEQMNRSPLLFTENKGQIADYEGNQATDVLFTTRSNGIAVFLTATGIHYQFIQTEDPNKETNQLPLSIKIPPQKTIHSSRNMQTHRVSLRLVGANPSPVVRKELQNVYTENFYLAHCPEGITDVHTYERLTYENVYPGIDWVIYSNTNAAGMKYDFIVHPGADPSRIKIEISDAVNVNISQEGALVIKTTLGTVTEQAPETFSAGKKIPSSFILQNGRIGFNIGHYDNTQDLRIDPSIIWATYCGGSSNEMGYQCALDNSGNVYLTGVTSSYTNMAAAGYQNIKGSGLDGFLLKCSSTGVRLWATYYGSDSLDVNWYCAADADGNVYISGVTTSVSGIASPGAFQTIHGGARDAFLVKFNSVGHRLWATYYGGSGDEEGFACIADKSGNVYLGGKTSSATNIAAGGFQNNYGGGFCDAFVVKFDSAGIRQWATYYGGNSEDGRYLASFAVDGQNNVYFTSYTTSSNGIASGGFQNTLIGGGDAFLVKFSPAGNRLWATYYGGNSGEGHTSCTVDGTGNVFLAGCTNSTSGITSNGFQNLYGGGDWDSFLVKFDSTGMRQWATYFGGTDNDYFQRCGADDNGNVYLTGITSSSGLASPGYSTLQRYVFLAKFNSAGARQWSTYLGGNRSENWTSCAVTGDGTVYLGGTTFSDSGIAQNGFQNTFGGGIVSNPSDAFLLKFGEQTWINTGTITGSLCAGMPVTIPFVSAGTFSASNIYTAQLSSASGSFTAPTVIGTLTSASNAGSIAGIIPATTPPGNAYRIRVVSSAPYIIGTNNGTGITIHTIPQQPGPITGDTLVCPGSATAYSINPVPGANAYTWTLPPGWIGNSTTASISVIAGTSGGVITVIAVNACGSTTPSVLSVRAGTTPFLVPAVSIAASGSFCTGIPVTLTAVPVNGGAVPTYQWTKNGINVGINAPNYTEPAALTGDVFAVTMLSSNSCAISGAVTSNTIIAAVHTTVIPGININTIPPHLLCSGTPIHFITNITGGGANPQYEWYKNGIVIPGITTADYLDTMPVNGDTVQVVLVSSATCPLTPRTYSNKMSVVVDSIVVPSVTIHANPGTSIPSGQWVTFNAIVTHGGNTPAYQWVRNGNWIPGAIASTYSTNTLSSGDIIKLQVTSNASCATPAMVTSAPLVIQTSNVGIQANENAHANIRLYPNPNNGQFRLAITLNNRIKKEVIKLEIMDVLGQILYACTATPENNEWTTTIQLQDVANGIYLLRLKSDHVNVNTSFEVYQ